MIRSTQNNGGIMDELIRLIEGRQKAMTEIKHLNYEIRNMEDKIKKIIIKEEYYDLIAVNWVRVARMIKKDGSRSE